MTKHIKVDRVLYYYDGVQVFDAVDAIGGHYIGLCVADLKDGLRFLVVGASLDALQRFRLGEADIRSLIENRAEPDWFLVEANCDIDQPLPLIAQEGQIPEDYLPDAGFVLENAPSVAHANAVRNEALARRNVVVELTLEPPEASAGAHMIRADKLSGLLLHLQSLMTHAYAKSIANVAQSRRRRIDRDEAPLLNVAVPALAGSFRIVLVAVQGPDLLGGGEIERALAVVDYLASVAGNPEETLNRVQQYRGHTANAYLRLLRFIISSGVSMRYAWAAPDREDVSDFGITRLQAEPLVTILTASESLGAEQVTLVGQLRKVDVDAGTWRLHATEEDRDYSGKVRSGVTLSHLETDGMYRFLCDEEVEELTGAGREVRTLYLTAFSDANNAGSQTIQP
jgi:hypothetical protein